MPRSISTNNSREQLFSLNAMSQKRKAQHDCIDLTDSPTHSASPTPSSSSSSLPRQRKRVKEHDECPSQSHSVSSSSVPSSRPIFDGCKFFIMPPRISKTHFSLLRAAVEKQGGTVLEEFHRKKNLIIICESLSREDILQTLSLPKFHSSWSVHRLLWLTESLRLKQRLPPTHHIVPIEGETSKSNNMTARDYGPEEVKHCSPSLSLSVASLSPTKEKEMREESETPYFSSPSASVPRVPQFSSPPPSSTSSVTPIHSPSATGAVADVTSFNSLIVSKLEELSSIYEMLQDRWRSLTYEKASQVCKTYTGLIECEADVDEIPRLGDKTKEKMKEVIRTGSIDKLESLKQDSKVQVLLLFGSVMGIGPKTALALFRKGHRTLDDLRSDSSLDKRQRLGVELYDDLHTRIPRSECEALFYLIRPLVLSLFPTVTVSIVGSYRRQKASCGDIDILINSKDVLVPIIPRVLTLLKEKGIITHDLGEPHFGSASSTSSSSAPSSSSSSSTAPLSPKRSAVSEDATFFAGDTERGTETYSGICRLPNDPTSLYRRIDMRVYGPSQQAFALLYFTGSGLFNRMMRLYSFRKYSLRLSDKGLIPVVLIRNGDSMEKVEVGQRIICTTEKEIFERLELPYFAPQDREGVPPCLLDHERKV